MQPMRGRDVALATTVALVWAFNFVVIKYGLGDFPPLLFAGLRFTLTAFPAVLLVGRGGMSWRLILTVGSLVGVGYFSLLFIGMHLGMPPGLSALISQAQVLFTALLSAALLREPPTRAQSLGILLALAGLGLAASDYLRSAPMAGFALVLLAALAWGFGNIAVKRMGSAGRADGFRLMVWMSLVPPLPNFLFSALLEHGQFAALAHVSLTGLLAVAYTAFASTLLGWGAWAWLLRRYAAPQVAPFSLLVPVLTYAMSAVLTGEALTPTLAVASGLMLGGVGLSVFGHGAARILPRLISLVPGRSRA